jgi:hypothetical protein
MEIFGGLEQREDATAATHWTGIISLPRLTHVAFGDNSMIPLCVQILNASKTLHVLIILNTLRADLQLDLEALAADPRFVVTLVPAYREDWLAGILTGRDYWARADDFIAKRLSGEIDRKLTLDHQCAATLKLAVIRRTRLFPSRRALNYLKHPRV